MDQTLLNRWKQVQGRLLSDELLNNKGLGNEIGFYIFDYEPEFELDIRDALETLIPVLNKERKDLKIEHINLFSFIIEYLEERKLLDRAIDMQKKKGDPALLKALDGPLRAEKIANRIQPIAEKANLVLLSGVGSVWPILRTHTLLNALHSAMGQIPLVMFYPGKYDGQQLILLNKLPSKHYYRAFQLVPA